MASHRQALTAVLVVGVVAVVVQCGRGPAVENGGRTEQTLPAVEPPGLPAAAMEVGGWRLDGEPLAFVGDALYELVNGGAELYHQHGFVAALSAQYADPEGRSISLEVFEMIDADGARGIYAEKAGASGEAVEVGDEAALESYYMNFRRDRYLVTVTGFDSDAATTDGILALARAVDDELGGGV